MCVRRTCELSAVPSEASLFASLEQEPLVSAVQCSGHGSALPQPGKVVLLPQRALSKSALLPSYGASCLLNE